jgi:hypothetical protein
MREIGRREKSQPGATSWEGGAEPVSTRLNLVDQNQLVTGILGIVVILDPGLVSLY